MGIFGKFSTLDFASIKPIRKQILLVVNDPIKICRLFLTNHFANTVIPILCTLWLQCLSNNNDDCYKLLSRCDQIFPFNFWGKSCLRNGCDPVVATRTAIPKLSAQKSYDDNLVIGFKFAK